MVITRCYGCGKEISYIYSIEFDKDRCGNGEVLALWLFCKSCFNRTLKQMNPTFLNLRDEWPKWEPRKKVRKIKTLLYNKKTKKRRW